MDHCAAQEKDEGSVISEEAVFKPKYKNDSRKWLIVDGSPTKQRVSVFKDTYKEPNPDVPLVGTRTKIIREKLMKEAQTEIANEYNKAPDVEEYTTSYNDDFCPKIRNYTPTSHIRDKEKYEKHPLYASSAMSFWQFNYVKNFGNPQLVRGLTKIVDMNNPFKRNSNFSKLPEEKLGNSPDE